MKFGELEVLFSYEIENVKINLAKADSLRYIIIAYQNVLKKLHQYSINEMVTEKRINALDITDNMKNKLNEMSKVKISKRMQAEIDKQIKINKLKQKLNELLGIGDKKINELIAVGLTSVKQLKLKKWFNTLNIDTQMSLMHDIVRLIDWQDVNKFEHKLTDFDDKIKIVGSYRRHKPVVRDIDILFCKENKSVEDYLAYLKKTFSNNIWIYAKGNDKISFVIEPFGNGIKYKADIFITSLENYYSTLLYATGSQQHNIKMRTQAKKLNLLLNQNGIFKNGKKINKPSDDEKKLFALLDMQYVEPEKRF